MYNKELEQMLHSDDFSDRVADAVAPIGYLRNKIDKMYCNHFSKLLP